MSKRSRYQNPRRYLLEEGPCYCWDGRRDDGHLVSIRCVTHRSIPALDGHELWSLAQYRGPRMEVPR